MKNFSPKAIAFLFVVLILNGCNPKTVEVTVELNDLELALEEPVFAGSNTLQLEVPLALKQAIEEKGGDRNQITEAVLTSAALRQKDESNFDNFESVLLQLFNENTPMTEVAQLTTIPAGSTKLELEVSKEKKATDFFKQDKIGIVIDANLKADDTTGRTLICDLKFTAKAKAK